MPRNDNIFTTSVIVSDTNALGSRYLSTDYRCVCNAVLLMCPQIDANDRRSRRDMSPQGRQRAAMLGRDCRTVSGIGQSYYNSQVSYCRKTDHSSTA